MLARHPIAEHRSVLLRRWPERRVAQLVRLADGVCVVNFHGSARVALAEQELAPLWELAVSFAGGEPLVLGGDLNLREPIAPLGAGAVHLTRRDVDHLFALGMHVDGSPELLDRRVVLRHGTVELSDHLPLRAGVSPRGGF